MTKTYAEWKLRIGSPRELFWELQRFLEKTGFEIKNASDSLALESTPIEGHATFNKDINGRRIFAFSICWMFILGIILCFTIILIPVGIWLIKYSAYDVVQKVNIHLEGETFRASAVSQEPYKPQSEVVHTVSNARVLLLGDVYRKRGDARSEPNESEYQAFEKKLSGLEDQLDTLIPNIKLPDITK